MPYLSMEMENTLISSYSSHSSGEKGGTDDLLIGGHTGFEPLANEEVPMLWFLTKDVQSDVNNTDVDGREDIVTDQSVEVLGQPTGIEMVTLTVEHIDRPS